MPSTIDPAHIAIHAANVTLSLGPPQSQTMILRGIDLMIRTGETVAILGASGSGKSSLMAVLAGLERVSSGLVQTNGVDLGALNEDDLSRARRGRIGIVLQAFHLLPTMTARENVSVALELAGRSQAWTLAGQELAAVGLDHRMDHYPAQLSGGEQQRVAIARALAPRPSLLFADEPTGNLDGETGAGVMDLLFERQRATEATMVVITHDPSLAQRCARVVEMRDGRIVADRMA